MSETILIALIILAAAFLQGLTGFGFGLIALPLLVFFMDIKTTIPLMSMLAIFITFYLTCKHRKAIQITPILILLAATIPGVPLGVLVLKYTQSQYLTIFLATLMISFSAYQLLLKPPQRELGTFATLLAGFLSGTLSGAISVGGPPVIIYSAMQPWNKEQAKATLSAYFAILGIMVIASQWYGGLINELVLSYFMKGFIPMLAGIALGDAMYKRMTDHGYKKLAFILVFLLGWMLILKNV